jgi:hypothetical protein
MTKELNTLSTKKWENDYSGVTPTIDVTDGILVGDVAVDTSTSPYYLWRCLDNTDGAPVWIRIKSTEWGEVSGTLSDQTDLQSALNLKQNILSEGAFVDGDKTKLDAINAGGANTEQSIIYSPTIAPDLSLGNVVKVGELTGNITVNNPTNPTTAEEVFIRFAQDGTGSRTVTLGSDYVLLDTNSNYPSGANEVFWFSGITQSDGTIEGGFSPVDAEGEALPLTTKGDLLAYGTENERLPVGTNTHVLTADSTQSLGVKWAEVPSSAVAQGDVTQEINNQTGTTYTLQDSDHGKLVTLNNANPITLTVASGMRSDFECSLMQIGVGVATIVESSTTVNNLRNNTKTVGKFGFVAIRQIATNTFVTTGDME